MKTKDDRSLLRPRLIAGTGLLLAVAGACAMFSPLVYAGGTATPSNSEQTKLTGQELYAIHCNRCHSERYPTEWTPAHWRTIITHMRVRANLPAEQVKEILKYLEQDAGS